MNGMGGAGAGAGGNNYYQMLMAQNYMSKMV